MASNVPEYHQSRNLSDIKDIPTEDLFALRRELDKKLKKIRIELFRRKANLEINYQINLQRYDSLKGHNPFCVIDNIYHDPPCVYTGDETKDELTYLS